MELTPEVGADVGTYPLLLDFETQTSELNVEYRYVVTGSTVTVIPAPLTVTADNADRLYGGDDPEFSASYEGFVLEQNTEVLDGTLALLTNAEQDSDAGDYGITASGLSSGNYDIAFAGRHPDRDARAAHSKRG